MTEFEAYLLNRAVKKDAIISNRVTKSKLLQLKKKEYLYQVGAEKEGRRCYIITVNGEEALKEYKKERDSKICRTCACISAAAAVLSAIFAYISLTG